MNVANNLSGSSYAASLSLLRSANKQPELALQLLLQSMSTLQAPQAAAQTPAEAPVAASSGTDGGQIIDIMA